MTGLLQKAEDLLSQMNDAEKTQLLELVVRNLHKEFPGIESTPGVCGGEPCIARTRIPVWTIERARQLGTTDEVLLQAYPTLRIEDLERAAAYVRLHREDIERQIRENEEA
jgi:uncharacterized protein (DUF433 family)